jgi:hypothetical protein
MPIDATSRSGSRDLQKVAACPSRCGDHQSGSRRRICGRSQARSTKGEANS